MKSHWYNVYTQEVEVHDLLEEPTLKQMQEFVGGNIELVRLLVRDPVTLRLVEHHMIINEDGWHLELPRNDWATRKYHKSIRIRLLAQGYVFDPSGHSPILGSVIVFEGQLS